MRGADRPRTEAGEAVSRSRLKCRRSSLNFNQDEIVWDERKRLANIDKHGLDFADLDEAFFAAATIVPARKPRMIAVGIHVSGIVIVVFVQLGREGLGVVSMRHANRKERALING